MMDDVVRPWSLCRLVAVLGLAGDSWALVEVGRMDSRVHSLIKTYCLGTTQ